MMMPNPPTAPRVLPPSCPEYLTAVSILHTLRQAGHDTYLVGGCVRDLLLSTVPKDYDVATSALPEQVLALFPRVVEVGISFGVVRVMQDGIQTEVATFRTDGNYSDGRRPDSVTFSSVQEDVQRRDFTINGLLLDPCDVTDEGCLVVDHVGGMADLRDGRLRAIGDAKARFADDALRMLRAVRFAARLNLKLEPQTRDAIRELRETLNRVSRERIAAELSVMLTTGRMAFVAMDILVDLWLADVLWPNIDTRRIRHAFLRVACFVVPPVPGQEDTFGFENAISWPLALATILWPWRETCRPTVFGVQSLCTTWALSAADREALLEIWTIAEKLARVETEFQISGHVTTRAEGIRILRMPQADNALRLLRAHSHFREQEGYYIWLRNYRSGTLRAAWHPELHVTGKMLVAEHGIKPGRLVGLALRAAEDCQLLGGDAGACLHAALTRIEEVSKLATLPEY